MKVCQHFRGLFENVPSSDGGRLFLGGLASCFGFFESDHALFFFIPELEIDAAEAGGNRERRDFEEVAILVEAGLEAIVGDAAVEMMDVVQADIAGEPLENFGQAIVAAALETGMDAVPFFMTLPVVRVKLMLNIKHPDADCRGKDDDRQVDHEKVGDAEVVATGNDAGKDREIEHVDTGTLAMLFTGSADGRAKADEKKQRWKQPEHDDRMAIEVIAKLFHGAESVVFIDGQRMDIAIATMIEIAVRRMVQGVAVSPLIVGGEREQAEGGADVVIGFLRAKE